MGGAALAGALVLAAGVIATLRTGGVGRWQASPAEPLSFVGSDACASCHQAETALWQKSQHKQAMDHASTQSVRADFNDTSFDYNGVHSRFFRRDGKFVVETDGADGKLATFEVKYTFGLDPLQQYLIEFPDGRLQALSIAWDTRPKQAGGQRWFHLYPDEHIGSGDELHWTRLNQNWNFMCAACHSTGVRKDYDAAKDSFHTRFAEISVGCEACHGKGSAHLAWAKAQQSWWPFGRSEQPGKGLEVRFDERRDVVWQPDPKTGEPRRNWPPAQLRKEVETCGLCHARASAFSEDWIPGHPLSDTHFVSLMARGTFFPDGQMRDREETYNYAPFVQSRMFAMGVTCSDCHDPHSAKTRLYGDAVCLQCHNADKYAVADHHHHAGVEPKLACASCHMPEHSYMVVDRRHDHSLRVPRPDLSETLGTPNACNGCHSDRTAAWAAQAIAGWFGPDRIGFQHYGPAFRAAWSDEADAPPLLAEVVKDAATPAFVRASALSDLAPFLSAAYAPLAKAGLADADPLVRIGALDLIELAPPAQLWPLAAPLLSDPVRGVRIKAAQALAGVAATGRSAAERAAFDAAAAEFIAAQRLNADRPEARVTLGNFYARRGQVADAEAEFKAALRLEPQFSPAAVNLADLYRQSGRDGEGRQVLEAAIAAAPDTASLHYALGLDLVREKRPDQALEELRRAATLDPGQARYAYVYAVALKSTGKSDEAMAALKDNLARHPADRDTLSALVAYTREAKDYDAALGYAERLAQIMPEDIRLQAVIAELRQDATTATKP